MINHRWRNTYHYIIFYGILVCIAAMLWVIAQLPKEFKGGVLDAYTRLGQQEQTGIFKLRQEMGKTMNHDIMELRESIKNECFLGN